MIVAEFTAVVFAVLWIHWTDKTYSWVHPPIPYASYTECLAALPEFDDAEWLEAGDPQGRKYNAIRGWCLTIKSHPDKGT